jgi:RHS repeat-associated protein
LTSALGKESDGVTNRLHEQFSYHYDAAGNLRWRTNNDQWQSFSANVLNELTTVFRNTNMTVAGTTTSAATNVTVNGLSAAIYADATFARTNLGLVDGNNTFTAVARDSYGRVDTDTSTCYVPATNSFVYDLNGNLLSDGHRAFDYDDENELVRITVTNAWKSEFAYDGKLRRRIRKEFTWQSGLWFQTNEVHYLYDGGLVIQERWFDAQLSTPNPQLSVSYTRGRDLSGTLEGAGGIGGLLVRSAPSTLSPSSTQHAYYHSDGNGNVTCLINSNQAIVAKYLYDPYGNVLAAGGPLANANPYRFSSKEVHPQSSLVYYLYRYLEPDLQRWQNQDPKAESGFLLVIPGTPNAITGDFNPYTFNENDPSDEIDPLGLTGGHTAKEGDSCCLETIKAWKMDGYQSLSDCINKTRARCSTGWPGVMTGGVSTFCGRFCGAANLPTGAAVAGAPAAFISGYESMLAFEALISCDAGRCLRHGKLQRVGHGLVCK